jgi:RNA polymerase sigma-70 factor, ECF subfamily
LSNSKQIFTEAELVAQLKMGNEKAFGYLYDNYSKALFTVIYNVLQNHELSEDTLQESFVKIWKNIQYYDAEKGTLFTWMLKICRNLSIDKTRNKIFKNESQNQTIENNVNVWKQSVEHFKPENIGLNKLQEKLKPEYREIVDLVYYKGFSQTEAADWLNIPVGTVKTRCRAALIELRKYFD